MTFFYFRRQKKSGLSSLGYGIGQPGIPDDFYIRRLDGYSTVTSQVESTNRKWKWVTLYIYILV